jgi:hypothetical protein
MWAGCVACVGKKRNAYCVLVEKPEGKRSLEKCRRRWETNIDTDID